MSGHALAVCRLNLSRDHVRLTRLEEEAKQVMPPLRVGSNRKINNPIAGVFAIIYHPDNDGYGVTADKVHAIAAWTAMH